MPINTKQAVIHVPKFSCSFDFIRKNKDSNELFNGNAAFDNVIGLEVFASTDSDTFALYLRHVVNDHDTGIGHIESAEFYRVSNLKIHRGNNNEG